MINYLLFLLIVLLIFYLEFSGRKKEKKKEKKMDNGDSITQMMSSFITLSTHFINPDRNKSKDKEAKDKYVEEYFSAIEKMYEDHPRIFPFIPFVRNIFNNPIRSEQDPKK